MKRRLKQFYDAFGDRGVMFILYAFSVVINALMTICMELPAVFPEEISAAGIAAFYSGKDWSALLGNINITGGFIHSLFYAPLFMVFDNPYALYKAMLVINSFIVSFIPLIAYHLTAKLGIERVRYKLLTAVCCGFYVSVITGSKFITTGALSSLVVWILIWCIFAAWDKKNRYTRLTLSVLMGFLCAVTFGIDAGLIAAVPAVAITALLAKLVFKERIVNIPAFGLSLAVSFVAEHFARIAVVNSITNTYTPPEFFFKVNETASLSKVFGEVYAFMTESFGMGALAAAIFAIVIFSWIKEGIKNRETVDENGTKVYEPVKHKYNIRLTVFGIYQFLLTGLSMVLPMFSFTGLDSSCALGERTSFLAPIALLFVLVFVFIYGIDMKKLLFGTGIYAYFCLCFGLTYYRNIENADKSEIPLLAPFRFGENILNEPTGMSFIIMSSCVFSVFVLLIVMSSCTRKYLVRFISAVMMAILVYNTSYSAFYYLPETAEKFISESEPYKQAAEYFYDSPQSPPIIAYRTDPELAVTLQFLKLNTSVTIMEEDGKVPDSCLLIAENGVKVPFEGGSYDIVGKTDSYSVYAYGESARDFIRYSSASASGS